MKNTRNYGKLKQETVMDTRITRRNQNTNGHEHEGEANDLKLEAFRERG
jgi:hypothetical protein